MLSEPKFYTHGTYLIGSQVLRKCGFCPPHPLPTLGKDFSECKFISAVVQFFELRINDIFSYVR